ncbi:MAG: MBL fold metallo-hydrolase [Candidatus Micrarchaeota archaeon]
MEIIFLGTGTASAIPQLHCECKMCRKAAGKNRRTRASIAIIEKGKVLVVDTGPEYYGQIIREKIPKVDVALITHNHMDHTAGILNLRREEGVTLKAPPSVLKELKKEILRLKHRNPGLKAEVFRPFKWNGIMIKSVRLRHDKQEYGEKMPCLGFVFEKRGEKFAYLTDFDRIMEKKKLKNLDLMVSDGTQMEATKGHLGVNGSIKLYNELKPKKMLLTHMAHKNLPHEKLKAYCKKFGNIEPAFDGMRIKL